MPEDELHQEIHDVVEAYYQNMYDTVKQTGDTYAVIIASAVLFNIVAPRIAEDNHNENQSQSCFDSLTAIDKFLQSLELTDKCFVKARSDAVRLVEMFVVDAQALHGSLFKDCPERLN